LSEDKYVDVSPPSGRSKIKEVEEAKLQAAEAGAEVQTVKKKSSKWRRSRNEMLLFCHKSVM